MGRSDSLTWSSRADSQCQKKKKKKKKKTTLAKTLPPTARLVPSMRKTNSHGKLPLWAQTTPHTQAVSFLSTFASQLTTHLNHPSVHLRPESTTVTSIQMEASASTSSRTSGLPHLRSLKFCSRSVHC